MYSVYSIVGETLSTDMVLETSIFSEAVDYCLENFKEDDDNNVDFVIYDSENVIIWDTYSMSNDNYGVMGT